MGVREEEIRDKVFDIRVAYAKRESVKILREVGVFQSPEESFRTICNLSFNRADCPWDRKMNAQGTNRLCKLLNLIAALRAEGWI